MPHIDINFDSVPDQFEPVAPGVYSVEVVDVKIEPTKKNDGSEKAVVEMKITDGAPEMMGRKLFDHIGLKQPINLKQLMKSCGYTPGKNGLQTEELIGKIAKVRVKTRTYRDPDSGETKETPSIAEYMS